MVTEDRTSTLLAESTTVRAGVIDVALGSADLSLLESYLQPAGTERLRAGRIRAHAALAGQRVWAVSSTATGGGVAAMMRTLLPYWRGAGIDVRWVVVTGPDEFFRVTKRLHNWLHGSRGDSGPLGPDRSRFYAVSRRSR